MLNDIKRTTKNSTIYAIGNIAIKVVGLLLIPIYTDPEFLTKADFGDLAILEATAQILGGILTMSMSSSIHRWYWDKDFKDKQKSIFFTSLTFLVSLNIPVLILLFLKSDYLSTLIFGSVDYSYLLKLTFATVGITLINNQTLQIAKLQERSKFFITIQIIKLIIILSLTIWFIVYLGRGLNGIWEAALIGEFIAFVLLIPFTLRNLEWTFQFKILRGMIHYGYPLMLSSVATVVLSVTDRYMLHFISGLEATGIFALSLRFAGTLKTIISKSVTSALAPLRMKKMNDENNQRFYSKTLTYSAFLFIISLLALSLFPLEILKLVTRSSEYWVADKIIPILSFAFLFAFMRQNIKIGLVIKKQTKIMATFVFITAIINFGLNFLLIPLIDIWGAALATLISQLFYCFCILYFAQKAYPINYEWRKILLMIFMSILIILIGFLMADIIVWIRIPLKLILFISFPFILYKFNFYESIEVETMKKLFSKWKEPKKLIENLKLLFK